MNDTLSSMSHRLSQNLDWPMYCPIVLSHILQYLKTGISDQEFTCYTEIHTDDPKQYHLHMELTWKEKCWGTFYVKLIRVIDVFTDNYITLPPIL